MASDKLNDRELDLLTLALRYWRVQRAQATRKTDPVFTSDEIDLLISKLRGSLATEHHDALVSSTHGDTN